MTDQEARQRLDTYYAEALGQEPALLSQPGIGLTTLSPPHALAPFFKNSALILHAPSAPGRQRPFTCIAHPRLIEPLRETLADLTDERLFEAATLERLTQLVSAAFPDASIPPGGLLMTCRFVTPETFRPFRGPESASVKPLDKHELFSLLLLSRYSGGVYALRDEHGQILSRAGIRQESASVWEIGVRTEAEHLRGRGLAKTVVTAATEAILAAGRMPLYVHSATNISSERVALALGYQHYADEVIWSLP